MNINENASLIAKFYQGTSAEKQKAKAVLHNLSSKERKCFLIAIKPIRNNQEKSYLKTHAATLQGLENKLNQINDDVVVNSKSTHCTARISRWIKNHLGLRSSKTDLINAVKATIQDPNAAKIDLASLSPNRRKAYDMLIPLTKKIEEVSEESLEPKDIKPEILKLDIPEDSITTGHGEYIVFRNQEGQEKTTVDRKVFSEVQKIFQKYSPAEIVNDTSDQIQEKYENRYQAILEEVKKLDPQLEIAFVPRTLYELIFIKKGIQEDIKYLETCPKLGNETGLARHKCWHLERNEEGKALMDTEVEDIAYRLNKVMIKSLKPTAKGFTHQELQANLDKEIAFFQKYHDKCFEFRAGVTGSYKIFEGASDTDPTRTFGIGNLYSTTDESMQIVRNSLALECSLVAQHSFLLYRGAVIENDQPYANVEGVEKPYSLSYGTSLFAGVIYDPGATAFSYATQENKNAYVIPIPFKKLRESPFYIPTAHTILQLSSIGESFHPRTMIWEGAKVADLAINASKGIFGHEGLIDLESDIPRDELVKSFNKLKGRAIHLK